MTLDLDQECPHCGRKLHTHCERRECRLYFRWCAQALRSEFSDILEEIGDPCRKCGDPFADHFAFTFPVAEVKGRAVRQRRDLILLFPEYQACRSSD